MTPAAINAILNNAPLIIQGATRLIRMIREQETPPREEPDIPATLDSLKDELKRVDARLDANSESDVEQLKLIEELARQNEALAESMRRTNRRLTAFAAIASAALLLATLGLLIFAL